MTAVQQTDAPGQEEAVPKTIKAARDNGQWRCYQQRTCGAQQNDAKKQKGLLFVGPVQNRRASKAPVLHDNKVR